MTERILGVVLAGGLATRMGGADKALLPLGQRAILDEVLSRLEPQVDAMVINANGDPDRFNRFDIPCIQDSMEGYLGPLAGVLAALEYAREYHYDWVASVAADTPFFPKDFVKQVRSEATSKQASVVLASSFDHDKSKWMRHPTFGLWHSSLIDDLRKALTGGVRKIVIWTDSVGGSDVRFEYLSSKLDPFYNVNTPGDLVIAQEAIR